MNTTLMNGNGLACQQPTSSTSAKTTDKVFFIPVALTT